jgi:prepilin-type N-terminal cleavage/methylation domain-containing protein
VKRAQPGFTLLEVLISIAILALGLATVFGSSVMAARGTAHARMNTNAALLGQCRMVQVESYLRQAALPEADQTIEDPPETGGERCCEAPFTCTARVERIELPQPADVSSSAGDRLLSAAAGSAQGSSFSNNGTGLEGGDGGLGALGAAAGGAGAMGQLAGALGALGAGGAGGAGGDLSSALGGAMGSTMGGAMGGAISGNGAPNLQGMAAQMLTGIYPTLKPLLEGAIRKITVTVRWSEGAREFRFDLVQYITNPAQTMQSGDVLNAIDRALGGATGTTGTGGTSGTGATGTGNTRSP